MNAKELRELVNEVNAKFNISKEENAKKYVEESVLPRLEREARLGLDKYQIIIPYQYDTSYVKKALVELEFEVEYRGLGNLLVKW